MIVLDASAAVDLLLNLEGRASGIADRISAGGGAVSAPHLIDVEVLGALRRLVLRRQISGEEGGGAIAQLLDLDVTRYPALHLLARIWDLRPNLTAADACYVALAEALDAPLLTSDARLARAKGHRARIELVP